jgi:uncharacterized membrane protein
LKAFVERLRDSLFFVPAVFIAGGVGLALVTSSLDTAVPIESSMLPSSADGTRAILATVAAASATVAALVFSITAVTVQLAASQYSPRVLQGFLRDRFQQVVIGIVVGTFAFSLVGLATHGSSEPGGGPTAWTALAATALGITVIVGIVAFIDHVTRRIRVDDTISRLTASTTASMESWFSQERPPDELEGWDIPEATREETLRASTDGWVQAIDARRIAHEIPPGAIARVDVRVGTHVNRGDGVITVWRAKTDEDEQLPATLAKGITLGQTRTIEQDPGFGIRQLVDIALRALSPGVNDPTTAADVVHHLVAPLRVAVSAEPRRRVLPAAGGGRVVLHQEPDQDDLVRQAFGEIRLASARQPHVGHALLEALWSLRRQIDRGEGPKRALPVLDEQLRLVADEILSWDLPSPDLEPMMRVLRAAGLDSPEDDGSA